MVVLRAKLTITGEPTTSTTVRRLTLPDGTQLTFQIKEEVYTK